MTMSLAWTPQLLAIFASLVEDSCGVHYAPHDREVFGTKLAAHAADLGHDSLLDYYYRLRYDDADGAERTRLVEALLVHETYFFRELAPLRELVDGHLTQIIARRGHARVWSAACSTGEEPLTVAMLLDERGLLDRVELFATDISAQAVAQATSGRYRKRALRSEHPVALAERYLTQTDSGVAVDPRIRSAVTFRTLNLFDAGTIRMLGPLDVILCRNVLIYFSDGHIARVVDHLASALAPDGLLAVGVSESLMRFGTSMVCEERGNAFFYRKAR
ncbi:MAG: protein-glutamate O-methyltransferase CheR [Myxococcales bacterium]|nr:protein-glutamate O-methyltransferase CheR [Myxococcales bacterium]